MKKIYIASAIMLLIIFSTIIFNNISSKSLKRGGVIYAITLNGNSVKKLPTKGSYKVNVGCTNGIGKWDYENWKLDVSNIVGNISCDIDFTTISTTLLNEYIISLEGTTQGTGRVVHEMIEDDINTYDTGYRYEGKNPNNYVWFNNELWRIIGVFDDNSHGKSEKNLVKIIRAESIGGLAWDKSNENFWETSSLKALLNGAYLNHEDGNESEYCYSFSTLKGEGECDYRINGIQDSYRGMIEEDVTWYLGRVVSNTTQVSKFYMQERLGNSTTGTIGLMYASDAAYSALADSRCVRSTSMSDFSDRCGKSSWMFVNDKEWTIMAVGGNRFDVVILFGTRLSWTDEFLSHGADSMLVTRPVLYLTDSVKMYDGDGSIINPYIIGI